MAQYSVSVSNLALLSSMTHTKQAKINWGQCVPQNHQPEKLISLHPDFLRAEWTPGEGENWWEGLLF